MKVFESRTLSKPCLSERTKGTHQNIPCCTPFVLALWRRFNACGAVLLLNVANTNVASFQFVTQLSQLKIGIETGNTCTLATFYNAPSPT